MKRLELWRNNATGTQFERRGRQPIGVNTLPDTVVTASVVTSTSATLTWTSVAGAAGYLVGRTGSDSAGNGPWETTDGPSVTSRVFINLLPNTQYTLYCEPQPGGVRKSIMITTAPDPGGPGGGDGAFANIAVLGDSKVYQGGTGATVIANALKAKGWIDAAIRISGVTSRVPWGGAVTPTTQTTWEGWIAEGFNPKYVVLVLGGNIRTSSQSTWQSQFTNLFNMIDNGEREIFCMNLRYQDEAEGDAFNAWLKNVFLPSKSRAHLIDQDAMISDRVTSTRPVDWESDGVHMKGGANGYGLINTLLADRVDYFRDPTVRAAGPDWVRYEDIYVPGDDLQDVINRVTGLRGLSCGPGVFVIPPSFVNGYKDGIRFGHTSPAQGAGCRGLSGAGRSTIFRMETSTATQPNYGAFEANNFFLINAVTSHQAPRIKVELRNFWLQGTNLGADHDHNGLRLDWNSGSLIENVYITGIKGSNKIPPGETGSISLYQCDNITINNCELDGRRDGVRVSSALLMPNNCEYIYVNNCYFHHTKYGGGGIAWYMTNYGEVRNTRSEYIGSGSGILQGYSFNHEQANHITYWNPVMICDRNTVGGTLHMSLNSDSARSGVDNTLTVYNPTWDATSVGGGRFVVETWNLGANQVQRRVPDVYQADGVTRLPFYYVIPYNPPGTGVK